MSTPLAASQGGQPEPSLPRNIRVVLLRCVPSCGEAKLSKGEEVLLKVVCI